MSKDPKEVSQELDEEEVDRIIEEDAKRRALEIAKVAEKLERLGYDEERIRNRVSKMVRDELRMMKDDFIECTVNDYKSDLNKLNKEIREAQKNGENDKVQEAVMKYNKIKEAHQEKIEKCDEKILNRKKNFKNNVFSKYNI